MVSNWASGSRFKARVQMEEDKGKRGMIKCGSGEHVEVHESQEE